MSSNPGVQPTPPYSNQGSCWGPNPPACSSHGFCHHPPHSEQGLCTRRPDRSDGLTIHQAVCHQQSEETDLQDDCSTKCHWLPSANRLQQVYEQQLGLESNQELHEEGSVVSVRCATSWGQNSGANAVGSTTGVRQGREPGPDQLAYYDGVTNTVLKDMHVWFMLAITTNDAYPTGKMLEDMQDMAWKAAKLKYPNTFAASTIMELTASTPRMMLPTAYEIFCRAHTVAKEMVVQWR